MAPPKTHGVRGDANSGGSPCRHQWGADTRAAAGAAAAIADRVIMATAITSWRTARILALLDIHGIGVEP